MNRGNTSEAVTTYQIQSKAGLPKFLIPLFMRLLIIKGLMYLGNSMDTKIMNIVLEEMTMYKV